MPQHCVVPDRKPQVKRLPAATCSKPVSEGGID